MNLLGEYALITGTTFSIGYIPQCTLKNLLFPFCASNPTFLFHSDAPFTFKANVFRQTAVLPSLELNVPLPTYLALCYSFGLWCVLSFFLLSYFSFLFLLGASYLFSLSLSPIRSPLFLIQLSTQRLQGIFPLSLIVILSISFSVYFTISFCLKSLSVSASLRNPSPHSLSRCRNTFKNMLNSSYKECLVHDFALMKACSLVEI